MANSNVNIVQMPKVARVRRNPSHSFNVTFRPWQLTPCVLAPVLPGETMDRAVFQMRVATDPLQNKLTGWWFEFWLFYVKHRDMNGSDDFQAMMLDVEHDVSAYHAAATRTYDYTYDGGMKWADQARKAVVKEFFRDEGHSSTDFEVDNAPLVKINETSWLHSAANEAAYEVDEPEITVGVDDKFTATEIEHMMRQWEMLQGMGLQDMSYEDYLKSFGVRQTQSEKVVPELLRYERAWSYPSNTIDPSDGSAASAVTWSVSSSATKPRFFKEPGFVFGCMTARPKVYRKDQVGNAAGMLNDAFSWLPTMMHHDKRSSLKTFAAGTGPCPNITDNYVVDVRDLFLYGDQWVNHALTDTDKNLVDLPTPVLNKEYADSADMNSVFIDNTGASGLNLIRADGICSLSIKGRQVDSTPLVASSTA